MKLHNLTPAAGSVKKEKGRLGRGEGSGSGGTASKGHKGAKARSGYSSKRAFEGGQMPLHRRLPKRGFKNINRIDYKVLNLEQIDAIAKRYEITEVSPETLYVIGVLNRTDLIKILGKGEIASQK